MLKLPGYASYGVWGLFGTVHICDQCDRFAKPMRERVHKKCMECGMYCEKCHKTQIIKYKGHSDLYNDKVLCCADCRTSLVTSLSESEEEKCDNIEYILHIYETHGNIASFIVSQFFNSQVKSKMPRDLINIINEYNYTDRNLK